MESSYSYSCTAFVACSIIKGANSTHKRTNIKHKIYAIRNCDIIHVNQHYDVTFNSEIIFDGNHRFLMKWGEEEFIIKSLYKGRSKFDLGSIPLYERIFGFI